MTIMIMVIVPGIALIAERPQKVPEGPVGHLLPLLPRCLVCEAEVDARIDAGVYDILSGVREAPVRARVLNGRARVGGRY